MRKVVVTLVRTYSVPDEVTDQEIWDVLETNEGETLIDGNEDFHWAEDPLGKVTCDELTMRMGDKAATFVAVVPED